MSRLPIMAAGIAAHLNATCEGDATLEIRGVETLDNAGPDQLTWLGDLKLAPKLASTAARVIVMPPDAPLPPGKTAIRVPDPDLAMCDVLRLLAPPPPTVPLGVHPNAVIEPGATVAGAAIAAYVYVGPGAIVGTGTQLHPSVYVGAGSRIGPDCVLWPGAVIRERCTLGARVIVHANATIGADGFGYLQRGGRHVKIPQIGTVEIEDDVEIGAGSAVDRARSGVTRVRRGAKIDNLVQIGHNCDIGEDCVIVAQAGVSGSCTLGRGVVLAGQAGLVDHLSLGDGVVVTAQSGLTKDVPAGVIMRGSPAVPNNEYLREAAAARRLPRMIEQLRELVRRIERLESSTNDQGAG
ncbi:MAG: UDP-3-O-(3-hydroxymyristoyl)glucosamine N-acyltransferase [Phycisphaerae bacterium]